MNQAMVCALLFCFPARSTASAEASKPIPNAVLLVGSGADVGSDGRFQIDLIAGCFGALDVARNHIRPSKGLLEDPSFSESKYRSSVFAFPEESPVCVLGNAARPMQHYEPQIASLWDFAYEQFGCELRNPRCTIFTEEQ